MVVRVERPLLAARLVELNVPLGALPSENDGHVDGRFPLPQARNRQSASHPPNGH